MKSSLVILISFFPLVLTVPLQAQFEVQPAFPNLTFNQPVDLQNAGDGTDRIFVVERRGVIWVFPNDSNATEKKIFLDIQERVDDAFSEEGLLGLAFHPDYENNGYFYVNYTASAPSRTVISRFSVSATNPDSADENSEFEILNFSQPYNNHNGGQVAFGPSDGYLYIAVGDGGSGGDPQCNAQNLQTLLGSILRIDVDTATVGGPKYGIPPDNPFAGNTQGYREEIYAYGLRNPWRMSFDPVTGWLWAGDVGQNQYEEIDVIESGGNYGWNIFEGFHCYTNAPPCQTEPCDTAGLKMPIWEYSHTLGNSVTGGYVYRGATVPELQGKYVYADFGSGRIWSLGYDGVNPPQNDLLLDSNLLISSFGVDENQELYICQYSSNGQIYRFKPTVTSMDKSHLGKPRSFELGQNYPNPFNPKTNLTFRISEFGFVSLKVYDISGREVDTIVAERLPPGNYEYDWTAEGLTSGVYFYRLKAGEFVETRKMTLTK